MKYHFIGDQGVSMRGLKKYLKVLGNTVTGSDIKTGGHKAENITSNIDFVVKTSIEKNFPGYVEVEAALKNKNIKVLKRSELLGRIVNGKKAIAVAGAHGKTTVTTMAGLLLQEAKFDPTVFVGGKVREFDDDVVRIGQSDWFVLEACEYDRSFLDIKPKIAIITNIEEEHLDTYPKGLDQIREAFTQFLDNVPDDGLIIACYDDQNVREVIEKTKSKAKVIFYGFNASKYNKLDFALKVPGKHNILNALSILALADFLKIERNVFKESIKDFLGARNRFEKIGEYNGADLIDDYGHHPTEIKLTIEALAEKYPDQKKIVVFWPHQNRRTNHLFDQFVKSFDLADEVIIKPIFFIEGRDEKSDLTSLDLAREINKRGVKSSFYDSNEEIVDYLKDKLNKDTVLLTIGALPTSEISKTLIKMQNG